jgi:predicted metal-binding membrane protein
MATLVARGVSLRHPEWWLHAVAAGAAFLLVVDALTMSTHTGMTGPMAGTVMAPTVDHWLLMVLAMMLPLAAPQARTVALRGLWDRRHRSTVVFTVGLVGVWAGVGVLLVPAVSVLGPAPSWMAPGLLVAAAAWHVSRPRRRLLRGCGSVRLRSADGLAADVDCLAVGGRAALRDVAGCGVAMLPMVAAPMGVPGLLLMGGVLVVLLVERASGPNPATRAGRPQEACALLVLAVVVALASDLA